MNFLADDDNDSLDELRSYLTRRLSFVLIGLGVFGAWYLLLRRDLPMTASGLMCLLIAIGRVVQIVINKKEKLAHQILVWGIMANLAIAMLMFPDPWLPYFGILWVSVSAVLIKNGESLTAVSIAGLAIALNVIGVRTYPLLELIAILTLAAITSWLSAYTLFTAVHWHRTTQARATQLLEETRVHRAELSRTLKTLEIAYETQKHIQLELVWARKQADDTRRLKEQFAANISHELRTPLNLILGFSEIMYRSPEIYGDVTWPPTLRRDVHQIYRSSQHLLSLIDDILELSRFEMTGFNLTMETVSLEPMLKETIEIARDLSRGRSISLDLNLAPDLPMIEIDCTRIRQVVLNLLNNACSFTEHGVVELSAYCSGREVLISVRDTGTGIPEDKLPYLFNEFYQVDHSLRRSHSGAGLGLAISQRFVEAHGGRIWVESQEGVGSCFTFALPMSEFHHLEARVSDPSQLEMPHPCVLVVEKDTTTVALLRRYLKGCDLIQVRSAESLQEMCATSHPRAIILNERPGYQEIGDWNIGQIGVPIIECSLPSPAWIAEDLGIAGCLSKPISGQTLIEEIKRIGQAEYILVIDDDRGFALLVERILQTNGKYLEVQRAYDGREGLAAMRSRRPDLVLLDLSIPGLDGLSLLDEMHAIPDLADIPVVLLTANSAITEKNLRTHVKIYHQEGLYPIEVLNCLSVVNSLKQRYPVAV